MKLVMTTHALRQKLHSYLEVADDKKIKAMYIMMEEDIEESAVEYTDAFKKELDRRHAEYKSGKAKMITAAESKKKVRKLLKSGRGK